MAVEDPPAESRVDPAHLLLAADHLLDAHFDRRVDADDAVLEGHDRLVVVPEDPRMIGIPRVAGLALLVDRQIVGPEDHVLGRDRDGAAVDGL